MKKPSASLTSCFPCWSSSLRNGPRLQNACATPGSPSSGPQFLHLPPLPLSPETATDHFPVWAYQMNIYFSFLVLLFVVFLMFSSLSFRFCVCLVFMCWLSFRNPVDYICLRSCWLQLMRAAHPTPQTCYCSSSDSPLFHSCTKTQTNQGYVAIFSRKKKDLFL